MQVEYPSNERGQGTFGHFALAFDDASEVAGSLDDDACIVLEIHQVERSFHVPLSRPSRDSPDTSFGGERTYPRRMVKSLWAMVQGDPVLCARVNGWLSP
jgi:hypothetical protein